MSNSSFNGWKYTTSSNTADNTTNTFSYAWFGNDTATTGTWDYAPLSEMSEVEPERFHQWKTRIDNDPSYRKQQLRMNNLHDQWQLQWNTTGITSTNQFTSEIDGTTITNDFRLHVRFKPEGRFTRLKNYLNKFLKLNRTAEEIHAEKAEKKSWELVKDWLSEEEFAELTSKGEMEIQSKKDKETIYIIKKDPIATVEKRTKGEFQKRMCVIPRESNLPTGDAFLSKFLLLKQDEEEFEKIAIVRESA